jgi:prevent-host-death family protein
MATASAYEAKTHLSELLRRVEKGESITITRHGVPVARLVPMAEEGKRDVAEVIAAIKELRKGVTLGGLSIREMIEEGRQ